MLNLAEMAQFDVDDGRRVDRPDARADVRVRAVRRAMHATPGRHRGSDRRHDHTLVVVARPRGRRRRD